MLQAFNQRLLRILQKHRKRMVGWDEILHPDLPKDAVVQSWRGQASLAEGARLGYQGILSNGYYIDLIHPTWRHYAVDPLPAGHALSAEEASRVLGGEATMWAEWVTPETVDSRSGRARAHAERFWSPGRAGCRRHAPAWQGERELRAGPALENPDSAPHGGGATRMPRDARGAGRAGRGLLPARVTKGPAAGDSSGR
jgi:hypothetical protein